MGRPVISEELHSPAWIWHLNGENAAERELPSGRYIYSRRGIHSGRNGFFWVEKRERSGMKRRSNNSARAEELAGHARMLVWREEAKTSGVCERNDLTARVRHIPLFLSLLSPPLPPYSVACEHSPFCTDLRG